MENGANKKAVNMARKKKKPKTKEFYGQYLEIIDGHLYLKGHNEPLEREWNKNYVIIHGERYDFGRIVRTMTGLGQGEQIVYTHCEFCKKELPEHEQRIGSASHERCWKIWADRGRNARSTEDSYRINNGESEFAGIYDNDGKRFKDKEYGE